MGFRILQISGLMASALVLGAPAAVGQLPDQTSQPAARPASRPPLVRNPDAQYSAACKVKAPAFEGRAPLRVVRKALREKRPLRVFAVGSSSTAGIGASSPIASYPVRLENDLEGYLTGFDVEMTARGVSGEIAEDAADRMKTEIAELKPDLVVWQVGTNDALARIDEEDFADQLRSTLDWLAEHKIDVVLIDPQYVERLAKDQQYLSIVDSIAEVAREKQVLLVHRYDAMADLSREHPTTSYLAGDRFHLNDLGYRCMAEYAARAIVAGILQADIENAPIR